MNKLKTGSIKSNPILWEKKPEKFPFLSTKCVTFAIARLIACIKGCSARRKRGLLWVEVRAHLYLMWGSVVAWQVLQLATFVTTPPAQSTAQHHLAGDQETQTDFFWPAGKKDNLAKMDLSKRLPRRLPFLLIPDGVRLQTTEAKENLHDI